MKVRTGLHAPSRVVTVETLERKAAEALEGTRNLVDLFQEACALLKVWAATDTTGHTLTTSFFAKLPKAVKSSPVPKR